MQTCRMRNSWEQAVFILEGRGWGRRIAFVYWKDFSVKEELKVAGVGGNSQGWIKIAERCYRKLWGLVRNNSVSQGKVISWGSAEFQTLKIGKQWLGKRQAGMLSRKSTHWLAAGMASPWESFSPWASQILYSSLLWDSLEGLENLRN